MRLGAAPLAGCLTGRLALRPLDYRAAAELVGYDDPILALSAYGILGGIPLYLSFFRSDRSLGENIAQAIASPTARLYVEPQALFAAHHRSYDAPQVMAVLRAIAHGRHRWSEIADAANVPAASLARMMEPLIGDLGRVERVLPVTEPHPTRTYFTQYHLADNFFRFWFRFIEPNQGPIEFGAGEQVVGMILSQLSDYLGLPFEALCRDWLRLASAAGALPVHPVRVGAWWTPDHQLDVVGLDERGQAVAVGEAKWHAQPFSWEEVQRYLGHTYALGHLLRPDALHLLFSRSGYQPEVVSWASEARALLLTPEDLYRKWGRPC